MANASNAYATINPVRTNIGDTIQGIEKMDFAYRDEQRQIDAIEQARKEKEQAKKDKLREKMMGQIPKNYDTGSSSLNEFQAKIIQQGVNRLGEIYKELNNPNLNEDDRIKLEIEAQNIDDLPNNLKISTDNFSKQINDYKTGVANGSIFRNPDFEKKVLNGFENYVGTLQNGLPAVGFVDRNEDGTVNNLDVLPYDKLQQGIGNWSFQKQFDLDAMAIDAAKKVGYDDITTDNNFKSVQEKKAKISSVESVATNLLQNPDGTPTDVALSQMKKMGIEPNEQSLKQVKDYFMQRVLANTDYTKIEDVDYNAQTGRMSENRKQELEAEKLKLEKEKVKIARTKAGITDPISVQEISKAGVVNAENGGTYKGAKKGSVVYTLPKGGVKRIKTEGVEELITDILIDPKTNEVVISGIKYTTNADKTKTGTPFNRSTNSRAEEVNSFAQLMNNTDGEPYKDYKELREDLLNKNNTNEFDWSNQ
jgi:hypothetical protein